MADQYPDLQFSKFNSQDAYALGTQIVEATLEQGIALGVEIFVFGRTCYQYLPDALGIDKADWLKRKRNSVLYFGMSTAALYEKCKHDESLLVTKYARKLEDYTLTPGSIPLRLKDSGLVGAITVTGLAPEDDHRFVSEQVKRYFDQVEKAENK